MALRVGGFRRTESDTGRIECPYCGQLNDDLWEHFKHGDDEVTVECDHCNLNFKLVQKTDVTYTAKEIVP